jgi:prophage regulatory protein
MSDPLLRLPEVIRETGRSRTRIYVDIAAGHFPKPLKIGPRAVAWRSSDIERWKNTRETALQ